MQIPAVLAFVAGATLTLVLQRRTRSLARRRNAEDRPGFPPGAVNTPQLLAWIDAATQGWLILAPDLSIAYINARAERLLHISRNLLVRGKPMEDVLSVPQLTEAIISTRHQQRPLRSEWEQLGEPLEAFILPGSDEWLLVLILRYRLYHQQHQSK